MGEPSLTADGGGAPAAKNAVPAAPVPAWRWWATRIALAVVVVGALVGGARYWVWSFHHESTDDAFIDCHVVNVSSRVAGRVHQVLVADNQVVAAGDTLVELDPADFRARLDEAEASRDEARGKLSQAHAQLAVAEASEAQADADTVAARADASLAAADLARYHATTSGAVSRQAVDTASTAAARSAAQVEVKVKARAAAAAQVQLARAHIETAQAAVETASATVEQVRLQLSYTTIHAKEDGRVTNKDVMEGDWVQVGQTLIALVPSQVWVTANFKETQLRYMRPGQPVTIHVDAYDRDFRGRVDSIEAGSGAFFSLLPPENATGNYVKVVQRVPVKIVFEEAVGDVLLGPGMSVEPVVQVR
ncbi:MAG TPA: HlyD family secretion protein [Candidatus Binatia bacterium]|jgi:membrane fusion protein (multidrug efflux system)|nr:HlyD family secretion protein [Candidatus Binatia bacterium]